MTGYPQHDFVRRSPARTEVTGIRTTTTDFSFLFSEENPSMRLTTNLKVSARLGIVARIVVKVPELPRDSTADNTVDDHTLGGRVHILLDNSGDVATETDRS